MFSFDFAYVEASAFGGVRLVEELVSGSFEG
jgi:hypothetical protein